MSLSEIKQIIMFSNDGDKILKNHTYQIRKLKSKEQEALNINYSILQKSSEAKFLSDTFSSSEKGKKKG